MASGFRSKGHFKAAIYIPLWGTRSLPTLIPEEPYFVTRMRDNACYEVIDERPIPQRRRILTDQIIRLIGVGRMLERQLRGILQAKDPVVSLSNPHENQLKSPSQPADSTSI